MATIKYLLQTTNENAPIYLRLSLGRGKVFKRKTGLYINPKNWSLETKLPKQNNPDNKNLTTDLRDLKNEILKQVNNASIEGVEVSGDWLLHRINVHFKRINEQKQSEYITDVIEDMKQTAKFRKNGKGGIGLSQSRINSYNTLKNMIESFETKGRYKIKDVNVKFASNFLTHLIEKEEYFEGYALKKIADLKTVCYYAETEGIQVNKQLRKIQTPKSKNEYIIFLTPGELRKIEKAEILNKSLNNARKWLLLGCNIGQRGGDLLNINENNFVERNGLNVIEIKQQKTDKNITIPVLETTEKILKEGLPYKISIQKFNEYIKKVCEIAEVNTITKGYLKDKDKNRIVLVEKPKYLLIASHICRRSFATNQYGNLPTPLLMQITGHSTEKMFLNYIGKNSFDFAQQIADYYELQKLKAEKKTNLSIVKDSKKTS